MEYPSLYNLPKPSTQSSFTFISETDPEEYYATPNTSFNSVSSSFRGFGGLNFTVPDEIHPKTPPPPSVEDEDEGENPFSYPSPGPADSPWWQRRRSRSYTPAPRRTPTPTPVFKTPVKRNRRKDLTREERGRIQLLAMPGVNPSVLQISKILGIHRNTVRDHVKGKLTPSKRAPRRQVLDREDRLRLVAACTATKEARRMS